MAEGRVAEQRQRGEASRRLAALLSGPVTASDRDDVRRPSAAMGFGSSAPPPPRSQSIAIKGSSSKAGNGSSDDCGPGAAGWSLATQRRDRKAWTTLRERLEADAGEQRLTSVELEEILRQLMGVALPHPRIRGDDVAAVMVAAARVLPLSSGLLCSEFTRFVHKACLKEPPALSAEQLAVLATFFLQFIKTGATWYTAGAIRALGLVLQDHADRVTTNTFESLFAVLLKYLDPSGVDIEARYAATSCVSSICAQAAKAPEIHRYFGRLLRMVVENFRQQAQSLTRGDSERLVVKACTCSMKCIYTIVTCASERLGDRIEADLPSLLSSMRQVVGHGLVLRHDRRNQLVLTCDEDLPPTDSDSSLCGSDGSAGSQRGQSGEGLLARLRITVLHTLEAIAQHFPRTITSSVGLYLPEQTTPFMTLFNNAPSVLTILLADPCERVRIAAAKFLDAFWEKIPLKQYFRHPSSVVAPSTSFASMPKRISLMLYQVHVTLVYCIQNETEPAPLVQALKTTSSVIDHCPYPTVTQLLDQSDVRPRLGEVLQGLAASLYAAMASPDHSVRSASISCLSTLLTVPTALPALQRWLISTSDSKRTLVVGQISILCGAASLSHRSFLDEMLLIASRPDDSARSLLRLEAMSLLSKVAKSYSSALSACWMRLAEFMLCACQDMDPNVRLQAVKILENYIKGETHGPDECDGPRRECLDFMATHLIRAFHDTSHHVRASVCACFTLLRPVDWVYLKERPCVSRLPAARANGSGSGSGSGGTTPSLDTYTRIFLQTPRDSSPVVRAAGFRLLGSLCLAPAFKARELSATVVTAALEALSDSTLNVRVRAAWALGNVCTTLGPEAVAVAPAHTMDADVVSASSSPWATALASAAACSSLSPSPPTPLPPPPPTPPTVLYDLLPAYQLRHVVEKMLVFINDNDKVASSVARTLGLVCRWVYFAPFVESISAREAAVLQELLGQTMVMLSSKINAGSPKVRWNACHAIAKVLLCPGLPLASVHWAPAMFHALVTAVAQQENFKVRISACAALRVPTTRSAYGSLFGAALTATMDALETASDLKDVTEFRYKEQLETQLSFTLVHLLHVATEEDDALFWGAIRSKPPTFLYDWLYHNLHRMTAAIDKEAEALTAGRLEPPFGGDDGADAGAPAGASGTTEMHDVNPIRRDEILSAVRTLLRVVQRQDTARAVATSCLSVLYDAKLSLERDVLYSEEDLAFEF
ncbi:hypothetical protein ATCC90586_006727 [Pythium insidiosum]|nr:hypothetical protein ATCC90586_006727 [Pythium insidiosum]